MKLIININEENEELYWEFMRLKVKYKLKNHAKLLEILIEKAGL